MSTAIGHGLADPKRRGKPVSYANKGRRVLCPMGAGVIQGSNSGWFSPLGGRELTRTYANRRIERESGYYSGTRRVDLALLLVAFEEEAWGPGGSNSWGL